MAMDEWLDESLSEQLITNKTIFSIVNTEIELYIFETLRGDYFKLCLLSGMLPVSKGIEYKHSFARLMLPDAVKIKPA